MLSNLCNFDLSSIVPNCHARRSVNLVFSLSYQNLTGNINEPLVGVSDMFSRLERFSAERSISLDLSPYFLYKIYQIHENFFSILMVVIFYLSIDNFEILTKPYLHHHDKIWKCLYPCAD